MTDTQETIAHRWQDLQASARKARQLAPEQVEVRFFRIAGFAVHITFAGTTLAQQFTRSLVHLQVPPFGVEEPALRIDLWDAAATGVAPTVAATAFLGSTPFADGDLARSPDGRFCAYSNDRSETLLDLREGRAVGYVRAASDLSPYEVGKPLQPILFAWYGHHDVQPTHAACVALGGDGVLIGGAGGSGKSTTSLACTMAGFQYLADDYTALPRPGAVQMAYSLYASLWLEEEHSRQFEALLRHRIDGVFSADLKQPFALGDAHPEQMALSCTVRAVLLPRIAHVPRTTLSPATPIEAIVKMAPSSVLQLPFIDPSASLRRIGQLLRTVPAFWLDLGTDIATIPGCVEEALRRAKVVPS